MPPASGRDKLHSPDLSTSADPHPWASPLCTPWGYSPFNPCLHAPPFVPHYFCAHSCSSSSSMCGMYSTAERYSVDMRHLASLVDPAGLSPGREWTSLPFLWVRCVISKTVVVVKS